MNQIILKILKLRKKIYILIKKKDFKPEKNKFNVKTSKNQAGKAKNHYKNIINGNSNESNTLSLVRIILKIFLKIQSIKKWIKIKIIYFKTINIKH